MHACKCLLFFSDVLAKSGKDELDQGSIVLYSLVKVHRRYTCNQFHCALASSEKDLVFVCMLASVHYISDVHLKQTKMSWTREV